MSSPASGRLPDPAPLRVVPMGQREFEAWQAAEIPRHARAQVEAGLWTEAESLQRARAAHHALLPQGLATPGHHLVRLVAPDPRDSAVERDVGMLWFADAIEAGRTGTYLYDIEVDESAQGRGHGTVALAWLERHAREAGHAFLRLNVFAHNARARRLYERAGFVETNVWMRKAL